MTREEALRQADSILLSLISSGDEKIFQAANFDKNRIAVAGLKTRELLADKIQSGEVC